MTACLPDKSRTAGAILAHLSAQPGAQDSLEGITQWWLRERKSDLPPTLLKEVLADLLTQGLVERRNEGGTVTYRSRRAGK